MGLNTLIFIIGLFITTLINAQPIKSAFVFGEVGNDSNIKCQFNYSSSIAAVESALRYNRVSIDKDSTSNNNNGGIKFYLNVTNWEVNQTTCSVGVQLSIHYYDDVKIPKSNKTIRSEIVLCQDGATGFISKLEMQTVVNSRFKEYVDKCISEIEKNAR